MTKLIIIRGPSGAGKSTVAKELLAQSKRPTLYVEQDLFRPLFNQASPRNKLPIWEMVETNVMVGLNHNFDVIAEGIFNVQKPGREEMFDRIFAAHPDENYVFYLDASFGETLKRHETRSEKRAQFDGEAMKDWYKLASPMEHAHETIIPESSTLEETIALIRRITGV